MVRFFNQNEDVDAQECYDDKDEIKDGSSSQDNTKRANLPSKQLVIK